MSTLFIADLHLEAARPDSLAAALAAFERARRHSALWILGDLFEAWIGDDAGLANPVGQAVAEALAALAASGTAVHLMHGNRDFLLGEEFARAAGARLHREDEILLEIDGQTLLLLHGDTLCSADRDYLELRARLRDPAWQRGFLALPVPARLEAARELRAASREQGARKDAAIMDVAPAAVAAVFDAHGVTTMVHGHTHRPARHALESDGRSLTRHVLGDWHADGGEALLADAGRLNRVRAPAGTPLP